jgi:hypothetical protein
MYLHRNRFTPAFADKNLASMNSLQEFTVWFSHYGSFFIFENLYDRFMFLNINFILRRCSQITVNEDKEDYGVCVVAKTWCMEL